MLIIHLSLAAISIAALARHPRSVRSAGIVVCAAAVDLGLGARAGSAVTVVAPLITFLTAALTLSALVADSGLVERAATRLARAARGSSLALYLLVCAVTALLTVVVSLDGAIVLLVPLTIALHRRHGVPLAANLFGVVAVANTASIALPQGNPTNLVVISKLHLSATAFTSHMLLPGVLAAGLCILSLWLLERSRLAQRYRPPAHSSGRLTAVERRAGLALLAAALAAWCAPLAGVPPWWPFITVVAIAAAATRSLGRISVPWRIAAQVTALVIVVEAIGVTPPSTHHLSVAVLLLVAFGTGAIAVAINNLPASVWAATLLSAGPVAYGASIGLAVGALAAPQGSVATLIAADLAGEDAPAMNATRLAPLAIAATLAATLVLRLTL